MIIEIIIRELTVKFHGDFGSDFARFRLGNQRQDFFRTGIIEVTLTRQGRIDPSVIRVFHDQRT